MLLSVIVPAHNEQESIGDVLSRIPIRLPGVEIRTIVVDDGSTDDTACVAGSLADTVLRHPKRMGLAAAFRTGLAGALAQGSDLIATLDADGQYAPEELALLLTRLRESRTDLVVGDRLVERCAHMPLGNRVGNILGSAMLRVLVGIPIRDASSGFRVFTRDLGSALEITSPHTYTHEMLIQSRALGFSMIGQPVSFSPRRHGESKLVRTLRSHILRSCGTILRSFLLYHPLRKFLFLAGVAFSIGLAVALVGVVTRTTAVLECTLLSLVFVVLGVQFVVLGVLADASASKRRLMLERSS